MVVALLTIDLFVTGSTTKKSILRRKSIQDLDRQIEMMDRRRSSVSGSSLFLTPNTRSSIGFHFED